MREYQEELNLKIKAGTPITQIISYEWRRIHGCVIRAARENECSLYLWNNSRGIQKWDETDRTFTEENKMKEPKQALEWFLKDDLENAILLMEDLSNYFDSMQWREIVGRLRTISRVRRKRNLILAQPVRNLPPQLEKEVYILEIPLPDRDILRTAIDAVIHELDLSDEQAPENDLPALCEAALGLTELEATYTFREISIAKERLSRFEIQDIIERKEQIIRKSQILEYFHPREGFGDIGGLKNLKIWLQTRKMGFEADAVSFGMTPPKGVLLLGVQGCGKSLVAKAISSEWQLPLLRFDLGRVFGGIIGESESNIRRALNVAEAVSPSILWIDEIEKGLSGVESSNRSDSGTTARVFGTMLTWMQEKEKPVFVIATANNIEQLPPELLRKGRFDEIFFVDLPGFKSRQEIWSIHLKKRLGEHRYSKGDYDINNLANESIGYSGAEIEEAINEALYVAYYNDREVTDEDLITSIKETYPISKVMGEKIMKLREWASARARMASHEDVEKIEIPKDGPPKLKNEVDNPFI